MAQAEAAVPLQAATNVPLSEAALRAALGQLGSNSLALQRLDMSLLDLSQGQPLRAIFPCSPGSKLCNDCRCSMDMGFPSFCKF